MSFCTNCGHEIEGSAKFCSNCGTPTTGDLKDKRKIVYEGELHKCPSCGEVLESFSMKCSACGYEIRDTTTSKAIKQFASKLEQVGSDKEKANIIRNFPVPNTKEDIIEFMILATSNIGEDLSGDISDAWYSKIEQTYKKANLVLKNKPELADISDLYNQAVIKLQKEKNRIKVRNLGSDISEIMPVLPNIIIILIWLMTLFVCITCTVRNDDLMLLLLLDLVIGAIFIPLALKCQSYVPRVITVCGLALSGILIFKHINELIAIIFVVCATVIIVRMMKKKINVPEEKKLNIISFRASLLFMVFLLIVFAISSFICTRNAAVAQKEKEEKQAEKERLLEEEYNSVYEWPVTGLSQYLPKPEAVNGKIETNNDEIFSIDVYKVSSAEFENYVEKCKDAGFSLYTTESKSVFYAYNEEEYELSVYYFEDEKRLSIIIKEPYEMVEVSWPTSDLVKLIPVPDSSVGHIFFERADHFSLYVDNITEEQYNEYVDKCMKKGFDVDYSRSEKYYKAYNKKGYYLVVEAKVFDKMYIKIEKGEK